MAAPKSNIDNINVDQTKNRKTHPNDMAPLHQISKSYKVDFLNNGIFIIKDVLTRPQVKEIRKIVLNIAKWEKKNDKAHIYDEAKCAQRVWNLLNKNAIFEEIITSKVILNCMEWIFDRDTPHEKYYLSSFQAHILSPGARRQNLHIDTPVPEPVPDWPIKSNTIWVLDEFNDVSGATEYVSGSHKYKNKPKIEDYDRNDIISVNAKIGSVIVTHGALWHRSGGNNTKTKRVALLGSFAASYAREIANEENYSLVLDRDKYKSGSKELRMILGLEHGIRQGATYE
jgi:ectoine hydroxylase-related dioxygenase (phytanoyl-CoA dioxygenase family)